MKTLVEEELGDKTRLTFDFPLERLVFCLEAEDAFFGDLGRGGWKRNDIRIRGSQLRSNEKHLPVICRFFD